MPRFDQYQQKAQEHKHEIHACSFGCTPNPWVDVNSAAHFDFTRRWQKDIRGSSIDTVAEVEFSKHVPPLGVFKSSNTTQVYTSPAGEEFSH